jgi:hypothetical protein
MTGQDLSSVYHYPEDDAQCNLNMPHDMRYHSDDPRNHPPNCPAHTQSTVVQIERGSQAWRELRAAMKDPDMYKISLQVRTGPNGTHLALKVNEYTWTPTLDVTAP